MDFEKKKGELKRAFDATKNEIEVTSNKLQELRNRLQQIIGAYQTVDDMAKEDSEKKNKQQKKGK